MKKTVRIEGPYTEPTIKGNLLEKAALWYAEKKGWPVLPLHSIQNGVCTCGKKGECDNPGKHPRWSKVDMEHGCLSASTNPDQIRKWWRRWPDSNVGIATGKDSFEALDVDQPDGPDTLFHLIKQYGQLPDTIQQITGGGGAQYLFQPTGGRIGNRVKFAPCLDTRSDGGLIVVPPSKHISGRTYEWEASSRPDEVQLAPFPEWLIEVIQTAQSYHNGNESALDVGKVFAGLPEGERDQYLFRYACRLREKNLDRMEAEALILNLADICKPPFPEKDALRKVEQAWRYPSGSEPDKPYIPDIPDEPDSPYTTRQEPDSNPTKRAYNPTLPDSSQQRNLWGAIKRWVEESPGNFTTLDLDRELNLKTRAEKQNRSECLSRLASQGIIERLSTIKGGFRVRVLNLEEMQILGQNTTPFPITLPLGLDEIIEMNSKDIVLFSGETDSGKTTLIYDAMWRNIRFLQDKELLRVKNITDAGGIGLRYFSSEMHGKRVKKRLEAFGKDYPPEEFVRYVASYNMNRDFHDMVDPDGINFVDYIEVFDGEYQKIGGQITDIHNSLNNGIAIITLQKRTGTDVGRGGEATLEKPQLILAISRNKETGYRTAKIVKAKAYKGHRDPTNWEKDFIIRRRGTKIIEVSGWGYAQDHQTRRKDANYHDWDQEA